MNIVIKESLLTNYERQLYDKFLEFSKFNDTIEFSKFDPKYYLFTKKLSISSILIKILQIFQQKETESIKNKIIKQMHLLRNHIDDFRIENKKSSVNQTELGNIRLKYSNMFDEIEQLLHSH